MDVKARTILVAGAGPDTRAAFCSVCARLGLEVIFVETAAEALSAVSEQMLDVLMLCPRWQDARSDLAVIRGIEAIDERIAIVVVGPPKSGVETSVVFEAGCDDYLPTPFDAAAVHRAIERTFGPVPISSVSTPVDVPRD